MAQFYFDVREGSRLIVDDEGIELESLDAAERAAAGGALDIARECLPKGEICNVTVEVRDEAGRRVLTTTVSLNIQRSAGRPHRATLIPGLH